MRREDGHQLQGAEKRKISCNEEVEFKKRKYEGYDINNEVKEVVEILCEESLKRTSKNEDEKQKLEEFHEERGTEGSISKTKRRKLSKKKTSI